MLETLAVPTAPHKSNAIQSQAESTHRHKKAQIIQWWKKNSINSQSISHKSLLRCGNIDLFQFNADYVLWYQFHFRSIQFKFFFLLSSIVQRGNHARPNKRNANKMKNNSRQSNNRTWIKPGIHKSAECLNSNQHQNNGPIRNYSNAFGHKSKRNVGRTTVSQIGCEELAKSVPHTIHHENILNKDSFSECLAQIMQNQKIQNKKSRTKNV